MSKKAKKPLIEKNVKADGTTEYIITKSPQKTLWGRIVICVLAAMLGLGTIAALILVLIQL